MPTLVSHRNMERNERVVSLSSPSSLYCEKMNKLIAKYSEYSNLKSGDQKRLLLEADLKADIQVILQQEQVSPDIEKKSMWILFDKKSSSRCSISDEYPIEVIALVLRFKLVYVHLSPGIIITHGRELLNSNVFIQPHPDIIAEYLGIQGEKADLDLIRAIVTCSREYLEKICPGFADIIITGQLADDYDRRHLMTIAKICPPKDTEKLVELIESKDIMIRVEDLFALPRYPGKLSIFEAFIKKILETFTITGLIGFISYRLSFDVSHLKFIFSEQDVADRLNKNEKDSDDIYYLSQAGLILNWESSHLEPILSDPRLKVDRGILKLAYRRDVSPSIIKHLMESCSDQSYNLAYEIFRYLSLPDEESAFGIIGAIKLEECIPSNYFLFACIGTPWVGTVMRYIERLEPPTETQYTTYLKYLSEPEIEPYCGDVVAYILNQFVEKNWKLEKTQSLERLISSIPRKYHLLDLTAKLGLDI